MKCYFYYTNMITLTPNNIVMNCKCRSFFVLLFNKQNAMPHTWASFKCKYIQLINPLTLSKQHVVFLSDGFFTVAIAVTVVTVAASAIVSCKEDERNREKLPFSKENIVIIPSVNGCSYFALHST